MEGLTCGADGCASSIYVGDEYCYVYKLTLGVAGGAAAVGVEWDLRDVLPIIGNVPVDKGIEALACTAPPAWHWPVVIVGTRWTTSDRSCTAPCATRHVTRSVQTAMHSTRGTSHRPRDVSCADASSTGLFYAGIQQTSTVHALFLCDPTSGTLYVRVVSCSLRHTPDCFYTAVTSLGAHLLHARMFVLYLAASGPPPDCSYTAPSPPSIKPPLAPSAAANGVPVARAAAWHVSLVVGTLTLAFCYYSY
jgi:hypothetical protein